MKQTEWQVEFKAWQEFARRIGARAKAIADHRQDMGWKLAATVGIPRCGCSLHNASIDDGLKGWCFRDPKMLKVAKRANYMVTEWCWEPTRLADGIISRAYHSLIQRHQ